MVGASSVSKFVSWLLGKRMETRCFHAYVLMWGKGEEDRIDKERRSGADQELSGVSSSSFFLLPLGSFRTSRYLLLFSISLYSLSLANYRFNFFFFFHGSFCLSNKGSGHEVTYQPRMHTRNEAVQNSYINVRPASQYISATTPHGSRTSSCSSLVLLQFLDC